MPKQPQTTTQIGQRADRDQILAHIMATNPPAQVRAGQMDAATWAQRFLSDEPDGYTLMHVHPKALHYPAAPDMAKVATFASRTDSNNAPPIVIDRNAKMQIPDGSGPHDRAGRRRQPHTVIDGKHRAAAAAVRGDVAISAYVPRSLAPVLRRDSHRCEVEDAARAHLERHGHTLTGRSGEHLTFRTADGRDQAVAHDAMRTILGAQGSTWRYDPEGT